MSALKKAKTNTPPTLGVGSSSAATIATTELKKDVVIPIKDHGEFLRQYVMAFFDYVNGDPDVKNLINEWAAKNFIFRWKNNASRLDFEKFMKNRLEFIADNYLCRYAVYKQGCDMWKKHIQPYFHNEEVRNILLSELTFWCFDRSASQVYHVMTKQTNTEQYVNAALATTTKVAVMAGNSVALGIGAAAFGAQVGLYYLSQSEDNTSIWNLFESGTASLWQAIKDSKYGSALINARPMVKWAVPSVLGGAILYDVYKNISINDKTAKDRINKHASNSAVYLREQAKQNKREEQGDQQHEAFMTQHQIANLKLTKPQLQKLKLVEQYNPQKASDYEALEQKAEELKYDKENKLDLAVSDGTQYVTRIRNPKQNWFSTKEKAEEDEKFLEQTHKGNIILYIGDIGNKKVIEEKDIDQKHVNLRSKDYLKVYVNLPSKDELEQKGEMVGGKNADITNIRDRRMKIFNDESKKHRILKAAKQLETDTIHKDWQGGSDPCSSLVPGVDKEVWTAQLSKETFYSDLKDMNIGNSNALKIQVNAFKKAFQNRNWYLNDCRIIWLLRWMGPLCSLIQFPKNGNVKFKSKRCRNRWFTLLTALYTDCIFLFTPIQTLENALQKRPDNYASVKKCVELQLDQITTRKITGQPCILALDDCRPGMITVLQQNQPTIQFSVDDMFIGMHDDHRVNYNRVKSDIYQYIQTKLEEPITVLNTGCINRYSDEICQGEQIDDNTFWPGGQKPHMEFLTVNDSSTYNIVDMVQYEKLRGATYAQVLKDKKLVEDDGTRFDYITVGVGINDKTQLRKDKLRKRLRKHKDLEDAKSNTPVSQEFYEQLNKKVQTMRERSEQHVYTLFRRLGKHPRLTAFLRQNQPEQTTGRFYFDLYKLTFNVKNKESIKTESIWGDVYFIQTLVEFLADNNVGYSYERISNPYNTLNKLANIPDEDIDFLKQAVYTVWGSIY